MLINELDTPALIVDLDKLDRNLQKMAAFCKSHKVGLRPHTKTHKCLEIARMQMNLGAIGLAVAKVGEAEVMVDTGCRDIMIAYPIWGRDKLDRLMPLAKKTSLTVVPDSFEVAEAISKRAVEAGVSINIIVESDVGFHRTGIPAGPDVVKAAKKMQSLPGVKFKGLMIYPGHIWFGPNFKEESWVDVKQKATMLIMMFKEAKLPLDVVSTGGTPSSPRLNELGGITETRMGTYPFMDMNTVNGTNFSRDDCALMILATVVSVSVPGGAIIDGGSKTFSGDGSILGPEGGYGYVMEDAGIKFFKMNEEHGYLNISGASRKLKVGDKLRVIPNHVCAAFNMHDVVFGFRGNKVETEWKIAARGKIR